MTATDARPLPVPDIYTQAHDRALARFAQPGSHLDGATRRAIVEESRNARACPYCEQRAASLSPAALDGAHTTATDLPAPLVELTHRVTTDPGRLTRAWFDGVIASGLTEPEYVEAAGLVGASTVADTWSTAIEGVLHPLPPAAPGAPSGETNDQLADVGAYVGVMDLEHRLPRFEGARVTANISRALAMVPSAVDEFWGIFMPHYRPLDTEEGAEVGRPQIEFVASRTSAINECFY